MKVALLLWNLSCLVYSLREEDRIIDLPGVPGKPDFELFSGYLNASEDGTDQMFYWLSESRGNPLEDPLLIWLNGGPGESSLKGLFLELGPYFIAPDGRMLIYNKYSWNNNANILMLESPIGVGFSYNTMSEETLDKNAEKTAEMNFFAIRDFMSRVHPRYASLPFFIAGESYAGMYIPFLARRIHGANESDDFPNPSFQGMSIGNGLFDFYKQYSSNYEALYYRGLLPDWNYTTFDRCRNNIMECYKFVHNITLQYFGVGAYNLGQSCYSSNFENDNNNGFWDLSTDTMGGLPCYGEKALEKYFGLLEVQKAIHASPSLLNRENFTWTLANDPLFRTFKHTHSILPVFDDIFVMIKTPFRVLIYNGDTDFWCSPMGALYATNEIVNASDLMKIDMTSPYWIYNNDSLGGAWRRYKSADDLISYDLLTVGGAGHSVPMDRPGPAFQIITNFLRGEHLKTNYSTPFDINDMKKEPKNTGKATSSSNMESLLTLFMYYYSMYFDI